MWYLGIDFGTTGLSAVLCKANTGEQYPIAWALANQQGSQESSFRLPVVVDGLSKTSIIAGEATQDINPPEILLKQFKPYLKIGIPYYIPDQNYWEPCLQWSEQQQIPLYWLQKALQTLLMTLKPGQVEGPRPSVVGWTAETLDLALNQLQGVIFNCPAQWGEAYRFNIREAVLAAQLVQHSDQIFFIEDAIASILAAFSSQPTAEIPNPLKPGTTLIISAGATTTELAIVNLPAQLENLTHDDFYFLSFPYAGNAIDQDIFCQLLLKDETFQASTINNLQSLTFPVPGEPDLETRYRLQQQIQNSQLGQTLLEAASYLKLILQQQAEYTLNLGNCRWVLQRQDLERQVIMPFLQKLNQALNTLLSQAGLLGQSVVQVICTGGTAGCLSLQQWFLQKLPHATLIKDTHVSTGNYAETAWLRVATGLATLPFYPQVLDQPQQQYSDYFLLLELLRSFPEQPLRESEIMLLLERRGINTRTCYPRLIEILAGELPSGLVPSELEQTWLTPESLQNSLIQAIAAAPLFSKAEDERYHPNPQQANLLRQYFNTLLSGCAQKLEEPLIANFNNL